MTTRRAWRTVWVVVLVGITALGSAITFGPTRTAHAVTEINSFLAAPGIVRTDLEPYAIAYNPTQDLLYAAIDDAAGTRLVAVRLADLTVVAERVIGEARQIVDLEVGGDDTTLFVALERSGVERLDAVTLVTQASFDVFFVEEDSILVAAPGRGDRVVLSTRNGTVANAILDDTATDDSILESSTIGHVAFGDDADTLFVISRGGDRFIELSLDGPETIVRNVEIDPGEAEAAGLHFLAGRLVVLRNNFNEDVALFDPADFSLVDTIPTIGVDGGSPLHVAEPTGKLVINTAQQFWRIDPGQPNQEPKSWQVPLFATSDLVALGDGALALIENSPTTLVGFLTIVDANLMTSSYGEYHALDPARLVDTREPIGVPGIAPLRPDQTITVQISGRGGVPADGALAVVLNATVTGPSTPGFISIFPTGQAKPTVSSVNFGPGQTLANAVTVTLGQNGQLDLFNRFGTVDVIFDVVGYYSAIDGPAGARYFPLETTRLVDTRRGDLATRFGPLKAGESIEIPIPSELDNVDSFGMTPVAAALNVTAAGGTEPSFLSVYPAEPRPTTSSVNFEAGAVRANMVIATISPNRTIRIFNRAGSVDVVVDLFGLYMSEPTRRLDQQGRFMPASPFRAFDSRENSPFDPPGHLEPFSALITPNGEGWTDIINLTAASTTQDGFLSVIGWRPGQTLARPTTSNVNFRAGEIVANAAYATGRPNNAIVNAFGFTHVVVDLFGYLTPEVLRDVSEVWASLSPNGLSTRSSPATDGRDADRGAATVWRPGARFPTA